MTAEDRLRAIIGSLIMEKCMLEAELAKVRAELEQAKAAPKEG